MRKIVFSVILYLFAALQTESMSQKLGFSFTDDKNKAKIPFTLHNNLIVVSLILNDVLPLKFVLDTGVRTAILTDKEFSDMLDMVYTKKYTISGVGKQQTVDAYITNNVSFTLPGIEGKGHALLVLEEDLLELKNYLGTDVHGILGYELFSRFIVKINYANKIITLSNPETTRYPRRYDNIPMTIEDTKPYIYATVVQDDGSEVRVKVMIDSGSSQSLFLSLESDPSLKLPEKNIHTYVGRGLGGPLEGYVGRLNAFKIGSYEFEDIIANYPENPNYDSIKYSTAKRSGSIGGEILSRFNVIFDFPNQKFYFKKNRFFKKDFTYNLSGLVIKAKGPYLSTYEVSEVRKNSAGAKAGIQAGDIILSINENNYKDLELDEVIGILNYKSNKKITLRLKRGEQVLVKKFRLKDLI
ncbi:MAG: aspartyl protease family protein [Candidatus Cyclobacteriaceae bacterium M2_1C_046]